MSQDEPSDDHIEVTDGTLQTTDFLKKTSDLLEFNNLPEDELMSYLKTSATGLDMFMVGVARAQAPKLVNLMSRMDRMESMIFSDAIFDSADEQTRIELYKLVKDSFKMRTSLMRSIREQLDLNSIKAGVMELSATKAIGQQNSNNTDSGRLIKKVLLEVMKKRISDQKGSK